MIFGIVDESEKLEFLPGLIWRSGMSEILRS